MVISNSQQPTLMEVLQPRHFPGNPKRAQVTRTVLQPDIDKFEQFQVAGRALVLGGSAWESSPGHRPG